GIKNGQTPFGAVIVKDDIIIAQTHNRVFSNTDITAHAEMVAIKEACKNIDSIDLSGATIYTTCEPCPMCFGAIHWAKIDKIIYGANIKDAKNSGFSELSISNKKMKKLGESRVVIIKNILKKECKELFTLWSKNKDSKTY
ncbi:MAG: nucleoside deaminase, partial [Epsilonproteobacteria bacterium]